MKYLTLILLIIFTYGCSINSDNPHWEVEKAATPSQKYPLAGFWKEKAEHDWGLAITPAKNNQYSVSFCGPGGCFEPGTYRPDTSILNDPLYKIIDDNTIEVKGADGFTRYTRYQSRISAQQVAQPDGQ